MDFDFGTTNNAGQMEIVPESEMNNIELIELPFINEPIQMQTPLIRERRPRVERTEEIDSNLEMNSKNIIQKSGDTKEEYEKYKRINRNKVNYKLNARPSKRVKSNEESVLK